jgi:hypothetical protein
LPYQVNVWTEITDSQCRCIGVQENFNLLRCFAWSICKSLPDNKHGAVKCAEQARAFTPSGGNRFLSLGDGGILTAVFAPTVNVGASLFVLAGEVGGNGEDLLAVTISDTPPTVTPLPAALPIFAGGLGALGLLGWRRKRKRATAIAAA